LAPHLASDGRCQGIPIQRGPPLWSRALGRTSPRTVGNADGNGTDLSGAPDTQNMKGEEMDLILRFRCDSCHKEFMVADEQVDAEYLNCPHCPGEVEVPEDEESDEEEE